jgi:hypothetical protein
MIDLSIREDKENPGIKRARGISRKVTSIVLVLYILAVAIFVGWWLFFRQKEKTVSMELKTLLTQVTGKSEQEILVRKLAYRAGSVSSFVSTREDFVGLAKSLVSEEASVSGWVYVSGTNQKVSVRATDSASLESYSGKLAKEYPIVYFDSINWSSIEGWTAAITLGEKI